MKQKFRTLLDAFKKGASEDTTGLYQIINHLENDYGIRDEVVLLHTTLEFVRAMLAEGFKAGNSSGNVLWEDQEPDYVIHRIKTEWQALGKTPNIGDIVYFDLPD